MQRWNTNTQSMQRWNTNTQSMQRWNTNTQSMQRWTHIYVKKNYIQKGQKLKISYTTYLAGVAATPY
jgi:hypothetical protein